MKWSRALWRKLDLILEINIKNNKIPSCGFPIRDVEEVGVSVFSSYLILVNLEIQLEYLVKRTDGQKLALPP